ncbi:unnamed protein product, partial [Laminaria digitata]
MSGKSDQKFINALNRRMFIKYSTGAAAMAATTGFAAPAVHAQGRPVKIGFVSPQTGPLAPFGEADRFVLAGVNQALANGMQIGKKTYPVEIIAKDSQSNP